MVFAHLSKLGITSVFNSSIDLLSEECQVSMHSSLKSFAPQFELEKLP
jgi:hypothetical protein